MTPLEVLRDFLAHHCGAHADDRAATISALDELYEAGIPLRIQLLEGIKAARALSDAELVAFVSTHAKRALADVEGARRLLDDALASLLPTGAVEAAHGLQRR